MRISEIGGEFALIERVTRKVKDKSVKVGIWDDAAVIKWKKNLFLVLTTDMLVENDHFSLKWSTPFQIGAKAMEANVSDIAAMGALPKYALVSIALSKKVSVKFAEELYRGFYSVARKYGFELVGGDTTHGKLIVLNVCMVGEVDKRNLRLRSDAKVGDLICVTGDLGKSAAGLEVLRKRKKGNVKQHLEPKARLKEAGKIAPYVNAMIDVSDGLASEVRHICEMSSVGARIFKERIPLSKNTKKLAKKVKKSPHDFALNGGEDFELVFTTPKKNLKKIRGVKYSVVGEILPKKDGIFLLENGKKTALGKGFEHF